MDMGAVGVPQMTEQVSYDFLPLAASPELLFQGSAGGRKQSLAPQLGSISDARHQVAGVTELSHCRVCCLE